MADGENDKHFPLKKICELEAMGVETDEYYHLAGKHPGVNIKSEFDNSALNKKLCQLINYI